MVSRPSPEGAVVRPWKPAWLDRAPRSRGPCNHTGPIRDGQTGAALTWSFEAATDQRRSVQRRITPHSPALAPYCNGASVPER